MTTSSPARVALFKNYHTGTLHSSRTCSVGHSRRYNTPNVSAELTHTELAEMVASGNWKLCEKCGN